MFKIFGAIAVVGMFAIAPLVSYNTIDYVKVTVNDKERITSSGSDGNTSSKYLIFTENEVFENTDSFLQLKFSSSDVYGRIKQNDVCEFKVNGFRVPFLSMYRNILEAKCVTPEKSS